MQTSKNVPEIHKFLTKCEIKTFSDFSDMSALIMIPILEWFIEWFPYQFIIQDTLYETTTITQNNEHQCFSCTNKYIQSFKVMVQSKQSKMNKCIAHHEWYHYIIFLNNKRLFPITFRNSFIQALCYSGSISQNETKHYFKRRDSLKMMLKTVKKYQ